MNDADPNAARAPLCINCRHFINADCKHESNMKYSFVMGKMMSYCTAQFCRTTEARADGTVLCGPSGRFHERAPDPYPDAAIRRDLLTRYEGRPEHDLDLVGRPLKAGR